MTRYARAKGSKASNEKLPNEATPWYLMKQQLEENKNKELLEKKKSAKELLNGQKDIFYSKSLGNINYDWADFDNKSKLKKKLHKNLKKETSADYTESYQSNDNTQIISSKNDNDTSKQQDTRCKSVDNKKNKLSNQEKEQRNNLCTQSDDREMGTLENKIHSSSVILTKRQKRNQKRKLETSNNEFKKSKTDTSDIPKNVYNQKIEKKSMNEKIGYKRRKPDNGITKMIINGVEVEIVKYDGFPVKKEDAERLTELKQKLIMKGIPKSEVDIAMKLERRKAEKALSRVKKLVCFHCRKSGHNLSDCPELGSEEICTGICFKCGSTEHTHFECKVNKDSTYRYATCFICREQGHIAAQCPDNPKGIYPQGGSCKVCGAVTHLKKDCPDLLKTKEDNCITVEKMDEFGIESLQEDVKRQNINCKQSKNKIVKF